ncbi:MAG: hypothetical protein R3C14_43100 [Caldilineaceae bacterium]
MMKTMLPSTIPSTIHCSDKSDHPTELTAFHVDPIRGFLPPQDPVTQLPTYYTAWEAAIAHLPALLITGSASATLKRLPPLSVERLETAGQVERAMLLLSIFASVYVWEGKAPKLVLPHNIAQPLWAVAAKLDRPPILSYTSIVLHNWRRFGDTEVSDAVQDRFDPVDSPTTNGLTLEKLALQHCFWGGIDEQWFYLISVAIEAAGAAALPALLTAQRAVVNNRTDHLVASLQRIHAALTSAYAILLRLPEKCHPYIFYHRIRQFIGGWPEEGVIYEGVSTTPHSYVGSSAAQSPLLQAIDAGLDIAHTDEKSAYLQRVRPYMQRGHRRFIQTLATGPSVRDYVTANGADYPTLCDCYNACVDALVRFRKKHLEIAVQYIAQQAPQQTKTAALGTGGTPFVPFLSQVRKETQEHLVTKEAS